MKTSLGNRKWLSYLFPIFVILLVIVGRNWYFTPNAQEGEMAKDFSAQKIDGQSFSLANTRGEFVLLHFWGSWCGPCRRQNPSLVALKKKLGNQLRIVSIGIEQKEDRWKAAIERDGLFWPDQIMDKSSSLKFLNGPISDLYGVNQVPTEFLLNKAGQVIATNPSPSEIAKFITDAR